MIGQLVLPGRGEVGRCVTGNARSRWKREIVRNWGFTLSRTQCLNDVAINLLPTFTLRFFGCSDVELRPNANKRVVILVEVNFVDLQYLNKVYLRYLLINNRNV